MECLVSTERSTPKAVSKLRAGAPIANITTSSSVYAKEEALASNATVVHMGQTVIASTKNPNFQSRQSHFSTKGSIRATCSVFVNLGIDTDIDTISSVVSGSFGSTDDSLIKQILDTFIADGTADGTITSEMTSAQVIQLFLAFLESSGFTSSVASERERIKCSGKFRDLDVSTTISGLTGSVTVKTPIVAPFFSASDSNSTSYGGALLRDSNGKIDAKAMGGTIACKARVRSKSKFINTYTDKIGGHVDKINKLNNYSPTQKFFPIRDINTSKNGVSFVDKSLVATGIYQSVDEGLFTGHYTKLFGTSSRISDEFGSFIQPSSIYSEGSFNYECELTAPQIKPIENFLFIRAAAPMSVLESDIPPQYRIHNIKWTDPDGNVISTYKDINIRGDSNFTHENEDYNFATYVTEPVIDNAKRYNWDTYEKLPSFTGVEGYKLNMDFEVTCFHKPFSPEFNKGYEDGCSLDFVITGDNDYIGLDGSPLSTQTQGFDFTPNNSIRISNIEIAASGSKAPLSEHFMPLYHLAPTETLRTTRKIYPTEILLQDYATAIHPEVQTLWRSSPDRGVYSFNNTANDKAGMKKALRDFHSERYIELISTSPIADSGKLKIKFEHEPPVSVKQPTNGEWGLGSKNPNSRLKSAKIELVPGPDEFFEVDTIELHVRARKAVGSRDYALDVVGYTDDGLLNVSSAVGGFLQNKTVGAGSIPTTSGFNQSNYLTSSAESPSSREGYFENTTTANDGGDHYLLTNAPLVTGTTLQDYVIPLTIYRNTDKFGFQQDYSGSNNFESLILDIYPLPTGAVIARLDLQVTYKPSNAITLHTLAHNGKNEVSRRQAALQLTKMKSNDGKLNSIWTEKPLSLIEDIPHAYTAPPTLKTNYARRWRGVDGGIKAGPFQSDQFDFAFENPPLYYPFTAGHYLFNDVDGNTIYSDQNPEISYTGTYNNTLSDNIISNLGMRFQTNKIFTTQDRTYRTIDWTTAGHELSGKIMDAFDKAVRVDQSSKNISYGDINTDNGFSVFARFSPDVNVSGADYNLFNSGVLVSKWDSGKDLEFTLGYKDGKLTGHARDNAGNVVTVQDPITYTNYSFPLATVLTYNDQGSNKLRLYTDNEIASGNFNPLRASSAPFVLHTGDSSLVVGHSSGSGVGMSAFVTEFGIAESNASGTLLVPSNASIARQESNIDRFFDSFRSKFWNVGETYADERFKLWDFINEQASQWHIGAFKFCEFGADFDSMSNRIGQDFILHEHKTSGIQYGDICQSSLPNSVVASGLSYHTQIENDFLRIHLDDVKDKFIAAAPRLVKTFPRGYDPATEAIAVDTIVEHDTTGDIQWPDGNIGPKLIVSLYTKRKETDLFDTTNWGLINRDAHYIGPKDCWRKLTSKFTVDNITDKTTEPWANFNRDELVKETNHHLYSNDVNDMFLQYDLAYPSGNFTSQVRMHSAEVRLEDALHLKDVLYVDDFNLYTSGDPVAIEKMNLFCQEPIYSSGTDMNLYCSGNLMPFMSGGMNLHMATGCGIISNQANPFSLYIKSPTNTVSDEFNLYTNGIEDFFSNNGGNFGSLGLSYEDNKTNDVMFGSAGGQGKSQTVFALYTKNTDLFNGPHSLAQTPLYVRGIDSDGNYHNNISNSFNIFTHGKSAHYWRDEISGRGKQVRNARSNLFVKTDEIDQSFSGIFNLYTNSVDPNLFYATGSMPLHTVNVNPINPGQSYLTSFAWNGANVGSSILLSDNDKLSLEANDEIRGVVTMCYGNCDNNGNCIEQQLYTHDTLWVDTQCIPGGVIRPINVYNNSNVVAYNTIDTGYENNYYGARKLTNLIPGAPYNITVIAKTATSGILEVPREITEIEYGTNSEVDYSGVKFVAEDGNRNFFDQFARSVDIAGDLLAVGVPGVDLEDNGSGIPDAGSVFVYRRNPAPSGYDWSEQPHKSSWSFETQLALPSGFRLDRYETKVVPIFEGETKVGDANSKQWYNGQKGRQLGSSVSVSSHNGRDVIVAGGPGSVWKRNFAELDPEPVKVILFVFTDEFIPTIPFPRTRDSRIQQRVWQDILPAIEERDTYYKYYCNPSVRFDVHIVICEGTLGTDVAASPNFEDDSLNDVPAFIHKRQINRVSGTNTISELAAKNVVITEQLKTIYQELFPLDSSIINNGLPPIVGFYVDNSLSYGPRAIGSRLGDRIEGGALADFQTWLSDYAYSNGLVDYTGTAARPFFRTKVAADEGWISQASEMLGDALDKDTIINGGAFTLFANNLGVFREGLSEFNNPPPSGGAAYVFEKLDYGWDLTQEIMSPTTTNDHYVDRYSHDVAISEQGNTIVIGSPFVNEAVQIFEYNTNNESAFYNSFSNWLKSTNDTSYGEIYQAKRTLNNNLVGVTTNVQAIAVAKDVFANNLSPSGRFEFRLHNNRYNDSARYQLRKTYGYEQVGVSHTWSWLTNDHMPTSRMGYSVDVSEDGSTVVVGCPTDGLGARDEGVFWYKPGFGWSTNPSQWFSNVNAGSVRILQGRKYYPHDTVMQYGIFGNLHRTLSGADQNSGLFNHYEPTYRSMGRNYIESEFTDPEIPQNVGTLMMITPEIDSLSDEVIKNIKEWLALGDRHLVLVGDDPVYEKDQLGVPGAYGQCNDIINRLLRLLDSRMTIKPAKNRYQSMIDQTTGLYKNIKPASVPSKTTPSFLEPGNLRASGVADIRLHDPSMLDLYNCSKKKEYSILQGLDALPFQEEKGYVELHDRCQLPIQHEGDLRAWYTDQCQMTTPKGIVMVNYQHNIAWNYQTHQLMDWGCDQEQRNIAPKETYEPTPVLAAAELINKSITTEAIPAETGYELVKVGTEFIPRNTHKFTSSFGPSPYFYWNASSGNYTDLNYNVFNTSQSNSKYLSTDNPILEENNKTAIAMAKSEMLGSTTNITETISPDFVVAAREAYGSSEVHLISMLQTEGLDVLNYGDDSNGKFYMNLTDKSTAGQLGGGSKIAQLSGFTGNTSFRDAYPTFKPSTGSALKGFLENLGNNVTENVDPLNLNQPGNVFDIAWIASPKNRPSSREIIQLQNWLNGAAGRKLIITFGDNDSNVVTDNVFPNLRDDPQLVQRINNVKYLLGELNLTMEPFFLDDKSKYADLNDASVGMFADEYIYLNPFSNEDLKFGYRNQLSLIGDNNGENADHTAIRLPVGKSKDFTMIAIKTNSARKTLYLAARLIGVKTLPVGTPVIRSGTIKASFAVKEKTFYRVFFEEASNFTSEKVHHGYVITNCKSYKTFDVLNYDDSFPDGTARQNLYERNADQPRLQTAFSGVDSGYSTVENNGTNTLSKNPSMKKHPNSDKTLWLERPDGIVYGTGSRRKSVIIGIPEGISEIDIYINADYAAQNAIENPQPIDTIRLLGISGVEIPEPDIVFGGITRDIYEEQPFIIPAIPSRVIEWQETREISSASSQYCPSDLCNDHFESTTYPSGMDVIDGPVTVAQEIYHQAPFAAGHERSRITVITDASMLQGINATDENNKNNISKDVIDLLKSFYRTTYGSEEFDDSLDGTLSGGTQYVEITKIVSPEKNSPARLLASEENAGFNNLFGRYTQSRKEASYFGNDENDILITKYQWIMPGDVLFMKGGQFVEPRVPPPVDDSEEAYENARNGQRTVFSGIMEAYGCYSKFNVEVDGVTYYDTGMGKLPPKFMETFGYDFLDFDNVGHLISGYPGDLFGYNVKINQGTVYVGSPFAAFSGEAITSWDQVKANTPNGTLYKSQTGYYGGVGTVYRFDRTMNGEGVLGAKIPWEPVGKIQPNSLSVGNTSGRRSDRFGSKITIDADFMAIAAPDHSDDSLIVRSSGEFVRKEFNEQFGIGNLDTYDTGDGSLSQAIRDSGVVVENQGAVYTYERKIKDWGTKKQDWVFLQKVIPQGYNSRETGKSENDGFATSIAVTRNARSDGDYNLIVGAPQHEYGTSGTAPVVSSGGAFYSYDAIMRRPRPSFAHPDTNIEGRIFGQTDDSLPENEKYMLFDFKNGQQTDELLYQAGVINANLDGQIFIEASGQDKNSKGYAIHRPFIQSINGAYRHGVFAQDFAKLFIAGKPPSATGMLPLVSPEPGGNVYNNMSMFNYGVLGIASGEMNLYSQAIAPSSVSDQGFNLYTLSSGVVSSGMNLYTRGKFVS